MTFVWTCVINYRDKLHNDPLAFSSLCFGIILKRHQMSDYSPCVGVLGPFQFLGHFWGPRQVKKQVCILVCNKYILVSFTQVCILVCNKNTYLFPSPKCVFLYVTKIHTLLLHTWVKKLLAINQCKRGKREPAAIEFKICLSQDVLCTLNSRQNRCRNRHPPVCLIFWQSNKQPLFLCCPPPHTRCKP